MKAGRHICTACNAIYEEPNEKLDPSKASFESLPEDWKCGCGAEKDKFQSCSCVAVSANAAEHEHETTCAQKSK